MARTTTEEAAALLAKLEALANDPPAEILQDDDLRRKLREAARNLSISMEMHGDTVHRIGNSALQVYMARVGVDAKIFETLVQNDYPQSCGELAEKTNVDPVLMKRLLRYYQSFRMIKQIGDDKYVANNVTKALTGPGSDGIVYTTTVLNPTFIALPEYLKTHGYKNPTNPLDSPWQAGYNTTEHPFVWLQSHPEHFQLFMIWLAMNRDGLPLWTDVFPFEQEVGKNSTDDTVLFVDIGSALGHISIGLREKYPKLPGRIIIQDTEQVISAANPPPGIESMVYDFFTPQPVKGARAYYMRNIIHDHEDEPARKILQNTMSAMTEESVILIDDMMLPESGAPWRATQQDMTMLTCLAAKERSVNEWYALLDSIDLKVVKVWKYTEEADNCIIVAKPAKFVK